MINKKSIEILAFKYEQTEYGARKDGLKILERLKKAKSNL